MFAIYNTILRIYCRLETGCLYPKYSLPGVMQCTGIDNKQDILNVNMDVVLLINISLYLLNSYLILWSLFFFNLCPLKLH